MERLFNWTGTKLMGQVEGDMAVKVIYEVFKAPIPLEIKCSKRTRETKQRRDHVKASAL